MNIVVTIPVYNEEETLGQVIDDIKRVMPDNHKVLVVDDGSSDRSASIAREHGAVVYSHPRNYGLAETFRTEVEKALKENPDIIVHIDADGQYSVDDIEKLILPIKNNEADLVLGSRFSGTIEKMPFVKRQGNRAFSKVISHLTKMKITDGQTGFRAFTKDVAERIKIKSRHTYTQEMIIRAAREKFRIKEVPVDFAKRKSGDSRLISNPIEYAAKAWLNIFRIYRDYEPLRF
jgi:glycosyltransferase involved in cell wall biosynthesis